MFRAVPGSQVTEEPELSLLLPLPLLFLFFQAATEIAGLAALSSGLMTIQHFNPGSTILLRLNGRQFAAHPSRSVHESDAATLV